MANPLRTSHPSTPILTPPAPARVISTPAPTFVPTKAIAHWTALAVGGAFLLIALVGFALPEFMGTHLSAVHNWIHLISGAAAIAIGLNAQASTARRFCFGFGAAYGLLGLAGFAFGQPGILRMGEVWMEESQVLRVIPGVFELGMNDHILHALLAIVLLAGATACWIASLKAKETKRSVIELPDESRRIAD